MEFGHALNFPGIYGRYGLMHELKRNDNEIRITNLYFQARTATFVGKDQRARRREVGTRFRPAWRPVWRCRSGTVASAEPAKYALKFASLCGERPDELHAAASPGV